VLDDHCCILFLVVGQGFVDGGQSSGGWGFAQHVDSDSCVWVHLCKLFLRTFLLSKSCGFITLALNNVAKRFKGVPVSDPGQANP
jgi:hypothetical protein